MLEPLSGPPKDLWSDRRVYHGSRLIVLLVVAAVVTGLFPPAERMEVDRYQAGDVATEDVFARVPFQVPKTPADLEDDRAEARSAVPPTFDYVPLAADTMAARLARFFGRVDSARLMGGMAALLETLSESSIAAQPEQVALLADGQGFDLVRTTAERAAREILPSGVADNSHLQAVTTDNITVRDVQEGVDPPDLSPSERSLPFQDVLSSLEFFERAVGLLPSDVSPDVQEVLRLVLIQYVEYTYRLNLAATELDRDAAARSVAVIEEEVLEGQNLVRAGDPITPARLQRLNAYENELRALGLIEREGVQWRPLTGAASLNVLLLLVFGLLVFFFRPELYANFRWVLTLAVLAVGYFVIARIIAAYAFPAELLPIAFVALTVSVLWDGRIALVMVMVLSVLTVAQDAFDSFSVLAMTLVGGSAAALSVRAVRRRAQTWMFAAIIAAAYAGVLLSFWMLGEQRPERFAVALAAAGGNAILSSVLAMGFIPVFELVTGITTDQTLLEWADPNRPLLKRLSMEAPGTYAHSINVANLGEAACNAIGANGLLCRVGIYHHDVGKTLRPHYFVENQPDRVNLHDQLEPHASAAIVKEHVVEGLRMAHEARVPDVVAAFVPEHHGTQRVGFFWDKAVELYGEDALDAEDYTYPGPKPQSRETTVAMLADSIESATRALEDPTTERIRELVHSIVASKMRAGQLDESPITLQEITQVEEAFVKMLSGVYHQRIDYPQTRHLTEEQPGDPGADGRSGAGREGTP